MENALGYLFLKLIFALYWIEIRYKKRYCQSHLLTFIKSIKKKKLKKQTVKLQMGKMVKASIYIENVCAKTKVMNLSAPLFHSFFTCWKTGKSTFCEKLSVITRVDYFVLHICWWWVEKNIFFDFLDLNFLQTRIKWNIVIINVKTKVVL